MQTMPFNVQTMPLKMPWTTVKIYICSIVHQENTLGIDRQKQLSSHHRNLIIINPSKRKWVRVCYTCPYGLRRSSIKSQKKRGDIDNNFPVFGGIPRYILSNDPDQLKDNLEVAVCNTKEEQIYQLGSLLYLGYDR